MTQRTIGEPSDATGAQNSSNGADPTQSNSGGGTGSANTTPSAGAPPAPAVTPDHSSAKSASAVANVPASINGVSTGLLLAIIIGAFAVAVFAVVSLAGFRGRAH